MKRWSLFTGIVAFIICAAAPIQAQVSYGPLLAWSDADNVTAGVGARAEIGMAGKLAADGPLAGVFSSLSGTYFFMDCPESVDCSFLEFSGNLNMPFAVSESLSPYAGAGLHYARMTVGVSGFGSGTATDTGLNVLGGLKFGLGGMNAFAEAKLGIGGAEHLVISAGVLFGGKR
jgi:hypothetical protein